MGRGRPKGPPYGRWQKDWLEAGGGLMRVVGSCMPISRHARWLWPLSLATLIVLASGRSDIVSPDLVDFDKLAHFGVFGLLATLIVRNGIPPRRAWIAVAATSLFGATDEWHQGFTPGRSVEVADWVADTLGALVAVTLYVKWPAYRGLLETPLRRGRRDARVEKTPMVAPNPSA